MTSHPHKTGFETKYHEKVGIYSVKWFRGFSNKKHIAHIVKFVLAAIVDSD